MGTATVKQGQYNFKIFFTNTAHNIFEKAKSMNCGQRRIRAP